MRWCAGRWWWRYLGDDIAGDPVRHLVAQLWIQLRCPGEELAGELGLLGHEARTAAGIDAHHASCGGIGGGGDIRGARSLITTVPAKMSPIRFPFADTRLQITAGPPVNIQISITPASARNNA